MKSSENKQLDMQSYGLGGSIIVLMLHYYHYCFALFNEKGFCSSFTDRLMEIVARTGLFNRVYTCQLVALGFLLLSVVVTQGHKDAARSWQYGLKMIGGGLGLYFGTDLILSVLQGNLLWVYIALTLAGYILILHGAHSLARLAPGMLKGDDPFGKRQTGFPQDEKKREGAFSVNIPARYKLKGQERKSWVNIINPRRGVMVIGSPGCGKSRFVIEPFMRQLMSKGMAVFVYDFKYDALSRRAWALFQEYHDKYPGGAGFYCVNFSDVSRSHRCNVLEPSSLGHVSDALGISRTILLSLNKSWVHRQGDFFVDSPISILAALIWWLRCYEQGKYCTLPHVIELCRQPYDKLFSILRTEAETKRLIDPFVQAYLSRATDMLEGQMASIKIPLTKLASDDLYYILSESDCSLAINDPAAPRVFCLGGDSRRAEALGPILSLYVDRINQLVNQPGQHPVALIYDEFPTIRAYSTLITVATARSNNVIPLLSVQDLSQLRTQYSSEEANAILGVCGNVICGQAAGETAKWVCGHFPRLWQDRTTTSTNSHDTSLSHSRQWENALTPAAIANLSSGEFVGIVSDDPDTPLEYKAFHARLQREGSDISAGELPVVRTVNDQVMKHMADKITRDIEQIVDAEYDRMLQDARLRGLVIRS